MKTKSTPSSFTRFRIYVSNLWFRYVKNPFYYRLIVEPKAKREREKKRKEIIKDFEEKQKTLQSRVKEVMYHETVYHENNPKLDYLNQKLVEGREHIIQMSPLIHRTPFFYEPEICDMHNEHIDSTKKNINQIMTDDDNSAKSSLKIQENKSNGRLFVKHKKTFTDTLKKEESFLDIVDNIEDIVSLNQLRQWDSEEEKLKHENLIKNLNSVLKR